MCDASLSSNENLQRQEDEKLCSCEEKHLGDAIAANQQLLQATNEEMNQAKRLQVSLTCGHVTESWLKRLAQRELQLCLCASCQDQLLRLKQKACSDQLTEASLQQDLAAKIQQVRQKTQGLQAQLSQTQQRSAARLRHASVWSDQAARKLQAAVAKVRRLPPVSRSADSHSRVLTQGQKVLRVAQMCHQLEVKSGVTWFCLEAGAPQPEVSGAPQDDEGSASSASRRPLLSPR